MNGTYQYIAVEQRDDVSCVRLTALRLDESGIHDLARELLSLIRERGCRRLALSLGPGQLEYLYSVFLAKLIMVQRVLREHGGAMVLCEVDPDVHGVFEACRLDDQFTFIPDFDAAVRHWKPAAPDGRA